MLYQWRTDPKALVATAVVLIGGTAIEVVYRLVTGRRLVTRTTPERADDVEPAASLSTR